jgi:hypothetical protein
VHVGFWWKSQKRPLGRPKRRWVDDIKTDLKRDRTMGTKISFPGVRRPGHEADHSPPTSAEVKKMWFYTSTPPYAFMA